MSDETKPVEIKPVAATQETAVADALLTVAKTMEKIQSKAEGKPAEPDPTVFAVDENHIMIDRLGRKIRHENGEAIVVGHVSDDKRKK